MSTAHIKIDFRSETISYDINAGLSNEINFRYIHQTILGQPFEVVAQPARSSIVGDTQFLLNSTAAIDPADNDFILPGLNSNALQAGLAGTSGSAALYVTFDAIATDAFVEGKGGDLAISDTKIVEGDTGTTYAEFTVTLTPRDPESATNDHVHTQSTSVSVGGQFYAYVFPDYYWLTYSGNLPGVPDKTTVSFSTFDGTAHAGEDYVATNGTLTFGEGVTSETIRVPIKGDTVAEADETFSVVLSSPSTGSTITTGTGTGTILDDDALFTQGADTVEFNSLTAGQQAAIDRGADPYHALGGDDAVTLPNFSASWYDHNQLFSGGEGNDTINGSVLADDLVAFGGIRRDQGIHRQDQHEVPRDRGMVRFCGQDRSRRCRWGVVAARR
jgi:hypothetical protein